MEEIPLDGFTSGEFHQHASPSVDSEVAVEDRVKSNLCAGVHFMAPSDHDIIFPYQNTIDEMGVSDRMSAPLTGVEISPLFTHIGAYGIPYDPYGGAGGAPRLPIEYEPGRWRVQQPPELIEIAREKGAKIIQINHPRDDNAYFSHIDYTPEIPIDALDPDRFTPDFDSVEVFNSPSYFCRNFNDWQGFLNQGLRITAVGNSDTHSTDLTPGYPRNYMRTLAPNPSNVTATEITDSMKTGAVTIGAGAFLDFPSGPQPGETVIVDGDVVELQVRIRTPSFARIDRLMVVVNGRIIQDEVIESETADLLDFEGTIAVPISEDAHITILAVGNDRLQVVRPGGPVLAMSNSIFADLNGDGLVFPGVGSVEELGLDFCSR